jgi:uncharacterized DUF497 family protein
MASEKKLNFDWDEDKAAANFKKHKVSFEDAKTVFGDSFAVTINDPLHSVGERRFIDIGRSLDGKILVVSYTWRGQKIRLINCRRATKAERKIYEEKKS